MGAVITLVILLLLLVVPLIVLLVARGQAGRPRPEGEPAPPAGSLRMNRQAMAQVIQEQQERLDRQQAEIDDLTRRLNILEMDGSSAEEAPQGEPGGDHS